MAIIQYKGFDENVADIAARDAIVRKINNMVVIVNDGSDDIEAGAGSATYRWDLPNTKWILVSRGTERNLKFITEEIIIESGLVTATHLPANSVIWDIKVLDTGTEVTELALSDVNISSSDISNLDDHDGLVLSFTYAYGDILSAVDELIINVNSTIDIERDRIDAIMEGTTTDLDQFKEIVAEINSIDLENDTSFGNYVTSNNTRVTDLETLSGTNNTEIGDLSTLNTTEKTNLAGAVNELYSSVPYAVDSGTLDTHDSTYFAKNEGDVAVDFNARDFNYAGVISSTSADTHDKIRVDAIGTRTIGMKSAQTYGSLNDWAMTFTVDNSADNGFLWRDIDDVDSDGAMSLSTTGVLNVKGSITSPSFVGALSGNSSTSSAALASSALETCLGTKCDSHTHDKADVPVACCAEVSFGALSDCLGTKCASHSHSYCAAHTHGKADVPISCCISTGCIATCTYSSSNSNAYPVVWRSGNTIYSSSSVTIVPNDATDSALRVPTLCASTVCATNCLKVGSPDEGDATENATICFIAEDEDNTDRGTYIRVCGENGYIYSGAYTCAPRAFACIMCANSCMCSPRIYGSTCTCGTCVRGTRACFSSCLCAVTCVKSKIVCGECMCATCYKETSARKLKENICEYGNVTCTLDKLSQLKPVTYNFKTDKSNSEYGLIADDVEDVYPEFVTYDSNGEVGGLTYSKMVSVLIQGVNDLNTIVKNQDKRIKKLEKQVKELI